MQRFWRIITRFWSYYAPVLMIPYLVILWACLWDWNVRAFLVLFIIVACCFLLPLGLAGFTKLVFFKHRPVPMELGNRRKKLMAGSFPSMHTITVVVIWTLWAVAFWESPYFIPVFCFYGVMAVLVMISRVKLKKHFVIDIFGGIGYSVVWLGIVYVVLMML